MLRLMKKGNTMKIAIVGYSASGKSTLAAYLGKLYGVAVMHLDTVRFLPGWVERTKEEQLRMVEDFMNENAEAGWVIDGNYTSILYERRMEEADRILFLNFSRLACLRRARKRYRTYRGRVRESAAEGCEEKLDREFVRWILFDGRTRERRARYAALGEQYPEKLTVIKNQRRLTAYMVEAGRGQEA